MRCAICDKSGDETQLYDAISDTEIVKVCAKCAEVENLPIINKPTASQLQEADRKPSVRERMDKLSGMNKLSIFSADQSIARRYLSKINFNVKKDEPDNLVSNYYWTIQMSRRRKKLSTKQLAELTGIAEDNLIKVEKGILPRGYEAIMESLETALSVKLFAHREQKINFIMPKPKEVLADLDEEAKEKLHHDLEEGKIDFSDKNRLEKMTLNDLIAIKKEKERKAREMQQESSKESLLGDEIDLEE